MTQEERDLLFKDLCARLPYGVKCDINDNKPYTLSSISNDYDGTLIRFKEQKNGFNMEVYLSEVKPYLFPLSSMTNVQLFEVQEILGKNEIKIEDGFLHIVDSDRNTITYLEIHALLNWFYKNHFDIYGLIPMGLAEDATGLNIY
jgi:hypothetical protein